MNKTYKVIYNRTRCMYQVVSELAKGRTKSETPEMLKTVFSKHGSLARGIVMAVLSMSLAMPVGVAVQAADTSGSSASETTTNTSSTTATDTAANADSTTIGTLDADGTYIKKDGSVSSNLSALDTQVKTNADAISKEKTDVTNVTNTVSTLSDSAVKYDTDSNKGKVTLAGKGGTTITNVKDGALSDSSTDAVTGKQLYAEQTAREALTTKIGTLDTNGTYIQKDASVSANLSTLDTQVKTNADAISKEKTDRADAISALKTELTSDSTNSSLASKANVNASNIGKNITTGATDDEKKQEDNAKLWGGALGLGAIEKGDSMLISGGTLYDELRPSTDGTYSYISNENTTAVNLIHLDSALNALGVEMLVDSNGNSIQYTSTLYKYFKVNPETTTNENGTKTYTPDAEANGTNSVAIGPNAKTATYTTTVTSGDTTTTTETAADHAVAIGDGATVNAAGDKGIALGNGAVTGEAETNSTDGTSTTTTDAKGGESSVAIGDSARANGNQALAFGKGASVLNPTGTAASTGSTAIGNGAKVDGGDNSIALGTSAVVNTVSDAMALGNGATINKTATGSIAIGQKAVTGGADKPITLTNGTTGTLAAAGGVDSIAIGNGAVSEGNEALALGKGAKVTNGATGGDSAAAIVKTGSAAIGDGATVANSVTSMALGNGASITEGENTTVIGSGAKATQTKQAFVAGYQASSDSSAESSVAIGDNASTHSARTTAIGYKAEAHNADSIAIGSEAKTDDNGGGIAIGNKTSVAQGGIAIGNATQASNISSLAIGNGAVANVNQSISIGYNAGVNTTEDYKERNGSLVAIGTSAGNNVKGMQNVAVGASAGSSVLSSNNIAIGTNAGYGIKNVTSETDTNPQNGYNISIGAGANYTEGNTNQNIVSSIAIGHNTHAVNRAVALGEGASAQGDSGMALGNSATSSGSGSIAIGNTASASAGNIALGAGAVATGTPTGTGKWTNSVAPSYYISVGGKGNASDNTITLRRISNVADGSADQDVVTVKQLQKVSDDLENTIKGIDTTQLKTYSTTEIDNKIAAVNQNIKDSGIKYFSINAASQSTNSNNTGANGDGDADAMAIGPNAKASSVKALAIGNNVSASGTMSIAIGTASNPSTDTTTAETPHPTSSEGTSSVAIGTSAIAQTNDSIAIGTRAATYTANTTSTPVSTVGVQSVAIGFSAETRDDNAISIGTKSKANSADAVAIGDEAEALNTNAVVIGKASTAEGSDSVTIGMSNANNGKAVITTGNSNQITNSQGVKDTVQNSGLYGSSNAIRSVSSSNTSNAITDVYAVGNGNKLNQMGEKNVLTDVSIMGNQNAIENGTAGAYTQTVKQIAVVGSGNTVKGNTQVNEDTWGTVQRDTILGYKNTVDATNQSTPVSNLQILGNDVKATLGNSVYLGTGSSATASKSATAEAITLAKEQGDAEAIDSDEYKKATTEAEQTAIKQKYEAQHIHAANIAAMDQDGISAGVTNYDTDYTYGNDSSYNYAGSQADGVVTVGSKDATRRIQNVSAGLVGPNSTDAVNGSQLYALTRQIRFGGDNSTFGKTTAADDVNVVAKGSNEKLAITGGAEGVSNTTTTDGKSVTTVDGTKITDKNIAVIAEDDALHVKLASNLKDLNTAQLGKTTATTTKADDGTETTTYSYQETLKLDGTGDNGGTLALKDAKGENGVALRTSGSTTTADVSGNPTTRLLVNDKTVATTDDGLKFGGDTGTESALKLNNKLTVKGGATTGLSDNNNIGVVSDGKGTLTVKLNKNVNLGTDGSLTAGAVTAATVTTGNSKLDNTGLTIKDGPKFTSNGISANNQQIKNVLPGTDDTDAANYSQIKKATTTLTTGKNGNVNVTTNTTPTADDHTNYTIAVDNLAVKANGKGNTSVELTRGINFKNGDNTTATVDADGTVTINATHNKLRTVSAATGDKDNVILTLTDVDGNTVTSTGLKNTYTTVTKDGTAHTVTFARNDGTTENLSLGDLDGASKSELATAAAKATSEVTNGTNVTSVTKTTGNNNQNIYTVNVDDLAVKTTDGEKKSVHLKDGLVFADGTNTTATVGDNGTIKFNVSDNAIKKQAVNAINVTGGSNVTVTPGPNADGTLKTFTVTATHNKLNATGAATQATADSNAVTLTLQDADGNTTTTGLTDTYTTVSKDATNKKVTFKRNDGETQTLELSDLGGITAAQDKYVTGGKVTYNDKGDGTAALTGNNGLAASITGLKDTKVSSGTASYVGTQGNASGSATLTMNDGSKVAITGLKDDYITSAAVGAETNHVTMTRLGGGTVNLNLNPILEKYSLSDYRLVGNGDSQDQAYQVNADGTVTLNVVDAKNTANKRTIQITGLASQSGVNAGRTTVKSSDNSVTVSDSTANSDTHTYDIKVDYSKIPGHVSLSYTGDTGSGSNTLNNSVKFAGTTNQVTTTAKDGQVTFALASDIKGINSVTTGNTTLSTNGVSNGKMSLTGTGMTITDTDASKQISVTTKGVFMGSQRIQNVANAKVDTDAATLGQVKNARTIVAAGSNVASVTPSEGANNQMTYTVNVDNLSVKANNEAAKSVTLQNGLTFNDGTNTTASVGENGAVSYNLNQEISLTKVTAGSSTLDTSGLIITGGPKVTQNGIDAGSQKITGVANGENAADAVNKGQLDALQSQVTGGWNLAGKNSDGTAVTAKIGAGKTVTYTDGAYTKSVVTKGDDDSDNATVKVDVTTGTLTVGADGRITSANGLATTQDVANAINSASITVVADNTPDNKTSVKAGDTIHFAKDGNLTLVQNGTTFTYGLNPEINISKVTTSDATNGSTVQDAKGITTTDAAGNTYIQNAEGITLTPSDKTKSPVKLTNTGLNNGGNKITDVADGELTEGSKEAVNGGQLYELKQKVGSGWKLTGDDTTQATNIGAGAQVSVKSGNFAKVTVNKSDSGATIQYDVQTQEITTNGGKAKTAQDGVATTQDVVDAINDSYWTVTSGQTGTGKATGTAVSNVTAGTAVTLQAGDNLLLNQAGNSFTYALNPVVTGMTSISFTGMGTGNDGKTVNDLVIGLQNGGGANPNKGYFITGLSNTEWNQSNYQGDRAATEAQLKKAIENVSIVKGGGGYGLTADEGANNGGDKNVTQALGSTIAVRGDGTYDENGNLVKTGNVKTVAYTDAAGSGQTGAIQIQLNKDIDLGTDGSLQAGGVTLKNNSVTVGTNGVVISSSGSERTVSNLSNIHWDAAKVSQDVSAGGYKNSGKAATEGQLAEAISTATSTAAQNEQHIRNGEYSVQTINNGDGSKSQGVSIDIITGDGNKPGDVKGHVVIKDVAKASDVGDVSKLHDTLKNPDGTKNVTGAINNLDNRVTGLDTRMNDIYTTAGQHSSVSSESNIVVDHSAKNESGGTDYKLSLNREKIDLGKVTIQGNEGSITAKSMTADTFTAGDTVVSKDGVKVGDKSALTGDSLKVGGKTYVDDKGINANGKAIGNVGEGKNDTEAVNVKQLNDVKSDYKAADTELAEAIQQTDAGLNEVGRAVNKLGNRLNRVGAGAAALAALHPGTYDPNDKWDFSAGIGHYHDANAVAIGAYYHPNDTTILSIGGSMGGGENMVNAGVTWKMGRSSHEPAPVVVRKAAAAPVVQPSAPVRLAPVVTPAPVTAPVPAKPVVPSTPASTAPAVTTTAMTAAPSGDTAALTQILARQTAILEKLAQNQSQAARPTAVAHGDDIFPDVPENHWAYAYVAKLEKAGALKGFKRPAVLKSPMMTRDDFASVLYTAMANGATTNPALNGDDSLNRLAQEFKAELKDVKP